MNVARLWRAKVLVNRATEYEEFAEKTSLPMFRTQPGFRGVTMLREGPDCLVLTFWADRESIIKLDSSTSYLDTVKTIRDQGFLYEEQAAEVYDAHLTAVASPT